MASKSSNNNEATSFGGGESRLIYEGKKNLRSDKFLILAITLIVLVLASFAVIGVISVINGSLLPKDDNVSGEGIKVNSNYEENNDNGIAKIIQNAYDSSVIIKITHKNGNTTFQNGFFISGKGNLVTEYFDGMGEESSVSFYYNDGFEYVPLIFDGVASPLGIAYLHVDPNLAIVSDPIIGNSSTVKIGQSIWAVPTSGSDFVGILAHGYVAAVGKNPSVVYPDGKSYAMIYTDFGMNSTLPGAPLLNSNGEIIGMCSSKTLQNQDNASAVIPINTVLLFSNSLAEQK